MLAAVLNSSNKDERLLCAGNAIKGKRDQYTIATKFGILVKDGKLVVDGSAKHVRWGWVMLRIGVWFKWGRGRCPG